MENSTRVIDLPFAKSELLLAFQFDGRGREDLAIPHYKSAIQSGLQEQDLRDALICLGSSLRVVGASNQAKSVLLKAKAKFPNDSSIKLFLALALHSNGEHDRALREIAMALIEVGDTGGYANPLRKYFRKLSRGVKSTKEL